MNDKTAHFESIKESENDLLRSICTFESKEDYTVYTSKAYPNYYGGNGLYITHSGNRTLEDWENTFKEHFTADHITLTFEKNDDTQDLIPQARKRKYYTEVDEFMALDHCNQISSLPSTFVIHKVESDEQWKQFEVFYDELSRDYDWYDPEKGTKSLFEKTVQNTKDLSIDWFYITEKNSTRMLGKLGLFKSGELYRLQDIMVHKDYRRKKLGTYLLSYAINFALNTQKAKSIALIADIDYHAINLHKNLGFQSFGQSVSLMKY